MENLEKELIKLGYFKRLKPKNYNENLNFLMKTESDKWICKKIDKLNKINIFEDFSIKVLIKNYKLSLNDIFTIKKSKKLNTNFIEKRFLNRKSLQNNKIFIDFSKYNIEKIKEEEVIFKPHSLYLNFHELFKEVFFFNFNKLEVIKTLKSLFKLNLNDKREKGLFIIYYYYYKFDIFLLIKLIEAKNRNKNLFEEIFNKIFLKINYNLEIKDIYNNLPLDLVRVIFNFNNINNIFYSLSIIDSYNLGIEVLSKDNYKFIYSICMNNNLSIYLKQRFLRKFGLLIHKYKLDNPFKDEINNYLKTSNKFITAYNLSFFNKLDIFYFKGNQFEKNKEKIFFLNTILNQHIYYKLILDISNIKYELLELEERRIYLKIMFLRHNYDFLFKNKIDFQLCLNKDLKFLIKFTDLSSLIKFKGIKIFDRILIENKLPENILIEMSNNYINLDLFYYKIIKQLKNIENPNIFLFFNSEYKIEIFNILLKHTSYKDKHYMQILYISLYSFNLKKKYIFLKMFKNLINKINGQQIYHILLEFLIFGNSNIKSIIYKSLAILIFKNPYIISLLIVDSFINQNIEIAVLKAIKYLSIMFLHNQKYKLKIKKLCKKLIPILKKSIINEDKIISYNSLEAICNTIEFYDFSTQKIFFEVFIEKYKNHKLFLKNYLKIIKNIDEEIIKPTLLTALEGNKKKRLIGLILLEIFRLNFRKNKSFSEVFNEIFLFK